MDHARHIDWVSLAVGVGFLVLILLLFRGIWRFSHSRPSESEAEEQQQRKSRERRKTAERAKEPQKKKAEPAKRSRAEPQPTPPVSVEVERERLRRGLARTRGGFIARLGEALGRKTAVDEALLQQVEEVLFTADIGVRTAQQLIDTIRSDLGREVPAEQLWEKLRAQAVRMVGTAKPSPVRLAANTPTVVLVVGVNGTGKTTTIGKLAAQLVQQGHRVMLAAGDTFRAAAANQLKVWADRAGADLVAGNEGADPTSVVVEALKRAKAEGHDIVLADTAGRLHTKVSLMEELQKVARSLGKHVEGAPHETLLVLDATTGQNAIAQAQMFHDALKLSGIVLTKLDGTAKGGVVLGIGNELKIPVRYVGIGEQVDDVRVFDATAFVDALFAHDAPTSQTTA